MAEVEKVKARWERKDEQDIDSAIEALLQVPNGRRFLWWLLSIGKVGGQPFSPDAAVTAFNCGELNIGNQIMARLMSTSPDLYTAMTKEMLNEQNDRDRELAHAADRDKRGSDPEPDWSRDGAGGLYGDDDPAD